MLIVEQVMEPELVMDPDTVVTLLVALYVLLYWLVKLGLMVKLPAIDAVAVPVKARFNASFNAVPVAKASVQPLGMSRSVPNRLPLPIVKVLTPPVAACRFTDVLVPLTINCPID